MTATLTRGTGQDAKTSTKTFLIIVKPNNITKQTSSTRVDSGRNATIATQENTASANEEIKRTTLDNSKGYVDTLVVANSSMITVTDSIDPTAQSDARTVIINMPQPTDATPKADEQAVQMSAAVVQSLSERNANLQAQIGDVRINLDAATLNSLNNTGTDLYFKVSPITNTSDQATLSNNAKTNGAVLQIAAATGSDSTISVQGTPYNVETNYTGYTTKLLIPFTGMTIPVQDRDDFLNSLRVYIEHTDGTKEAKGGTIVYQVTGDSTSTPIGIQITVNKFSNFQIFAVQKPKNQGGSGSSSSSSSNSIYYNTTKPVIALLGNSEVTLKLHDNYTDAGATAIDNKGTDITKSIVMVNSVNVDKVGDYTVTYTVTDADGNIADIVTRVIHVRGVERLSGQTRVDTALEIAKAYSSKVPNVMLATAENYPDALAGSVLAYKLNAPILLVGSTDADQQKILAYIKSNVDSAGTVYILGGTGAVSKDIEAKIIASGFNNINRIGGADRYETSTKITDVMKVATGTPIILVSGENYQDALSISSAAAVNQCPILLVNGNQISANIMNEISYIKPSKVYIIGLQGAISKVAEEQVSQTGVVDKANIIRIGGEDVVETSLEVAKYFNLAGKIACVAAGDNFPDAIAGSLYAAKNSAPIILIDKTLSDNELTYLKNNKLSGTTIFGGEGAVSKEIEQQLSQLLGK